MTSLLEPRALCVFGSAAELEPSPHGLPFYSQLLGLSFCVRTGCYLAQFASM